MINEIKIWYSRAKKDLVAAKHSLESGDYEWAGYQVHQSVEKALKAVYIKKNNKLIKIHDLVLLARKINAPNEIIELCSKINPSFLDTRHPDSSKNYTIEEAQDLINFAEEILKWTEKCL